MRTVLNFVSVATALFLSACEGNTDYTWQISNNSSSEITVWTTSGFSSIEHSVTIATNSTETVGVFNQLGGNATEQLPEQAFNSLLVVNAAGDTMQSSYIDPGSWIIEIEQIKKTPSQYEHTYTFVVENWDF